MQYDGNRLLLFEKIGSIVWAVFWGLLGYLAISERAITIGGRYGISHSEGVSAVLAGFLFIGASLVGISWLLRVSPYRRLGQVILFLIWVCSLAGYFTLFLP